MVYGFLTGTFSLRLGLLIGFPIGPSVGVVYAEATALIPKSTARNFIVVSDFWADGSSNFRGYLIKKVKSSGIRLVKKEK